jgi:hypothetical protein
MAIQNTMSSVNSTLYRQNTATISFNDSLLRKVGSAGTGASRAQTSQGSFIAFSQFTEKSYALAQIGGTNIEVSAYNNVNGTGRYVAGKTYGIFTIQPGSILGAGSIGSYGLYVQGFSSGDLINIENNGYIVGKGGDAGYYAGAGGQGGGNAMYVNSSGYFELYNTGVIGGGGAGGYTGVGYEDGQKPRQYVGGGGGGGGAGYYVGTGGPAQVGIGGPSRGADGYVQQDGGTGWNFYPGPAGGGTGSPTAGGYLGSGASVVGSNYLNYVQTGTILGGQYSS